MAIRISSLGATNSELAEEELKRLRATDPRYQFPRQTQSGLPFLLLVIAMVGAGGYLIGRRKAFRANGLLKASPEAFLMVAPITIPSYLGYRYAVRRMKPEDAALAEAWRDHFPSETDDGDWDA